MNAIAASHQLQPGTPLGLGPREAAVILQDRSPFLVLVALIRRVVIERAREPIADIPGLRWKVRIINQAQGEAGGIYLFDDDAAVQAFLDGPIIAEMQGDPTLSIKAFDVIPELTTVTRGPVK